MKYKYFIMLILLSSISFMGLSSGNVKEEIKETSGKNVPVKYIKTTHAGNNAYRFTAINHLLFM